ncbi:MAG: radical SAM protein [Candidatus Aenigmatarchaeota archaeon]
MEELSKSQIMKYLLSYFTLFPFTKPLFINIGLTHRCNLRCKICETWKVWSKSEKELNLTELKNVVNEIGWWGDINISFAGGEPLIRKYELLECIKLAKKWKLVTHVTSNGQLIDRKTAEELVSSGLDYLQISLDGSKEKTNDYIRGDGSYKKIIKAIKEVRRAKEKLNSNLKLSLTTVVTDKNLDELLYIVKLVEDFNLHEVSFNPYNLDTSYIRSKKYEEDEFWVKKKNIPKLKRICDELIKIKKKKKRIGTPFFMLRMMPNYFEKRRKFKDGICLAGFTYMYIKPNGDVDVCGKGPSLNVRENSIKKIWYSLNFAKTRLKIMRCKRPCLMLCFPRIDLRMVLGE